MIAMNKRRRNTEAHWVREDFDNILKLWLCRLLTSPIGIKVFVGRNGYEDQDIVEFLQLDSLEEEVKDKPFDYHGAKESLLKQLALLERRTSKMVFRPISLRT